MTSKNWPFTSLLDQNVYHTIHANKVNKNMQSLPVQSVFQCIHTLFVFSKLSIKMMRYPNMGHNYDFPDYGSMYKMQSKNYQTPPRRSHIAPSQILPSKAGLKLLNYLASGSGSKKETAYATTTTTTTTPAPPSPVLWMPGGDADCGGSDKGKFSFQIFYSSC